MLKRGMSIPLDFCIRFRTIPVNPTCSTICACIVFSTARMATNNLDSAMNCTFQAGGSSFAHTPRKKMKQIKEKA